MNSCFPYKILWLFFGVRKLACALRAMEHFHPHQSSSKLSKLPHSKERGTVVDSAYHHVLAWREALENLGIELWPSGGFIAG